VDIKKLKRWEGGLDQYGSERFDRHFATIRKSVGLKGLTGQQSSQA